MHMMNNILDKTDKGREEIATRKYHLAARLRTLLVLIDGKHTVEELLKQVSALGLNEESVNELIGNGFAHLVSAGLQPGAASAPVAEPSVEALHEASADTSIFGNILHPGETQFHAIYNFYTSTIKSTIGLRGYALQLKAERAASIDDFREMRQAYVEAVMKAKGEEMARSLRDRLDQLLNLPQTPDGSNNTSIA